MSKAKGMTLEKPAADKLNSSVLKQVYANLGTWIEEAAKKVGR